MVCVNTEFNRKNETVNFFSMIYLTEKIGRITEAADNMFNLNELNQIPTFSGRVKYCTEHLGKPIGRGSSRVVFQIDDNRVLKLAANAKGVAQNRVESEWYKQDYDFIPKNYNIGNDCTWIDCEFVLPAIKKDFKVCLGMSFEEFCANLRIVESQYRRYGYGGYSQKDYDSVYELAEELPLFGEIADYMVNGQIPAGDMTRIANWGLAQRNGQPVVVLLDHGLTMDVWNEYYKK